MVDSWLLSRCDRKSGLRHEDGGLPLAFERVQLPSSVNAERQRTEARGSLALTLKPFGQSW